MVIQTIFLFCQFGPQASNLSSLLFYFLFKLFKLKFPHLYSHKNWKDRSLAVDACLQLLALGWRDAGSCTLPLPWPGSETHCRPALLCAKLCALVASRRQSTETEYASGASSSD